MRPIRFSMQATSSGAAVVAASQTPSGAGAITIDGSSAVGGVVTFTTPQQLTITSTADISNRTFSFTGTDLDGNTISQTGITGPNNSTVATTKYFATVTAGTISGAAAGAITVGTNGLAISRVMPLDSYINPPNISVAVTSVSAGTYKMQYTYDNVQSTSWPNGTQNWTDDANMTGKTAAFVATLTALPTAIRIVITTAGTTPLIVGSVTQAGGGL